MKDRKLVGEISDPRCKQSRYAITRKTCRNNCEHWDGLKGKCLLGY